jgi:hypothetical protein
MALSTHRVEKFYSGAYVSQESILAEIDAEIERLERAKALLSGVSIKRGPGRPKSNAVASAPRKPRRRRMSAEGRARIAAGQKARWAKVRKGK